MSYCVNCGVELDSSAKKCALCSTPVINPNITDISLDDKPFSDKVQIPEETKTRFIAFVISLAMFIPTTVMFFLNVFFIREGYWSIYIFASALLLWSVFVLPFFSKKRRPYLMWAFDTVTAIVYSYIMIITHTKKIWALKSVLLLILFVSLALLAFIIWYRRKKRHWTAVIVVLLLEFTIISLSSGFILTAFSDIQGYFVSGIVCSVCGFVMMCFFIYCNKSRHVRAWLNKIFYI